MLNAHLAFDRTILPTISHPVFIAKAEARDWTLAASNAEDIWARAREFKRFDCKGIPEAFLLDTGQERYEELLETGERILLPFSQCMFEFSDCVVLPAEVQHVFGGRELTEEDMEELDATGDITYDEGEVFRADAVEAMVLATSGEQDILLDGLDTYVEFRTIEFFDRERNGDGFCYRGAMTEEEIAAEEYEPFIVINDERQAGSLAHKGAILLLGVLTLLSESLLRDRQNESVPPAVTRKMKKAGLAPAPKYHALTLNLAETRRRAQTPRQGAQHESPALHWRRGHYRVLHRKSEFEKKVWVRRTLVGDPDKGFSPKYYKAVWSQTIH